MVQLPLYGYPHNGIVIIVVEHCKDISSNGCEQVSHSVQTKMLQLKCFNQDRFNPKRIILFYHTRATNICF